MRFFIKNILVVLFWANAIFAFAQNPIPAFPEIQTVDVLLSSTSAQHYLKLRDKGNPLLDKRTQKVKQWIVNLKKQSDNSIEFRIRTHKLKSLYQGTIHLSQEGKWEAQMQEALPGQAVMLLFVADHIEVHKGRLAILSSIVSPFSPERIEAGKQLVESLHSTETELDFQRWKLGQLREFGDTGTSLPALRLQANLLLQQYLAVALPRR